MSICKSCGSEYVLADRRGKPGKLTDCQECADAAGDVDRFTGNMIYSHKTSAEIQINVNPALTRYINQATKLVNKGSNLGNNLKASGNMKNRTSGGCLVTADGFDYKNK